MKYKGDKILKVVVLDSKVDCWIGFGNFDNLRKYFEELFCNDGEFNK